MKKLASAPRCDRYPELPTTLPLFDRPLTSAEHARRCVDLG